MRRVSQTQKKPGQKKGNAFLARIGMGLCLSGLALAGAVIAVDRGDLPLALKDNAVVARIYDQKEAMLKAGAAIAAKHGDAAEDRTKAPLAHEQGYPRQDREKLDKLISTGAKTP